MLRVGVAQFPVFVDIKANLDRLREVVERCQKVDLLVLPEGVLSGYDHDLSFLDKLDEGRLEASVEVAQRLAGTADLHLVVGSCWLEEGKWYNAALGLAPDGERFLYKKINLAHHERQTFTAGDLLDVWKVTPRGIPVAIGVQLCREIRFPEQWRALATRGAQILAFSSNAIGDAELYPVWRSHLVSRAAENQRFVLAANNAAIDSKCPTMIVDPKGKILAETAPDGVHVAQVEIDPESISSWYLDQARVDLIRLGIRERLSLKPNPVIEYYKKDVDRTLLRENLKLTVSERIQKLQDLYDFSQELKRAGEAARKKT